MRLLLPAVLAATSLGCATSAPPVTPEPPKKELQMRTYYMAFLRRGPTWTAERTPEAVALGQGHMAHIQRLAACGKLALAGPFEVGSNAPPDALAGIFLFDVQTREEAVALTQKDPAVQAGRFVIEVMPWYGPTGLTYDGYEPPRPDARCEPEAPQAAH